MWDVCQSNQALHSCLLDHDALHMQMDAIGRAFSLKLNVSQKDSKIVHTTVVQYFVSKMLFFRKFTAERHLLALLVIAQAIFMYELYVRYDGVASRPPPFCTSASLLPQ